MEEGRKHIDDLFREGLEGYREMPDAAVWTSIEQRLPKRGGRRSFLWLWILLMLALLSSLGYYANKHYFTNDAQQARQETGDPSSGEAFTGKSPDNRLQDPTTDAPEPITEGNDLGKEENPKTSASEKEHLRGSEKRADKPVIGNKTPSHQQVLGEVHGPAKKGSNKSGSTINKKRGAEAGEKTDPDIASNTVASKDSKDATGNKSVGNGTSQAETTGNTTKTGEALRPTTNNDKANTGTGRKLILKNEEVKSDPDKKANNSLASSSNRISQPKEEKPKPSSKQSTATSQNPEEKNNRLTGQSAAQQVQASKAEAGAKSSSQQSPTTQSPALLPEKKAAGSSKQTAAAAPNVSLQPERKVKPSQPPAAVSGNTALQPEATASSKKTTGNPPVTVNTEKSAASKPAGPATSKGTPLSIPTEKGGSQSLPVTKETIEGAPISVQAAPNKKKSKMEVTYEDAKGNPISVEPGKEYGIKMNEEKVESDDKTDVASGGGAVTGKGTGGSGEVKNKNRIKLDGGIKLGHDRGFADVTTSNFTGNIFLQWNISKRTSLVLQPGLRYHSINKTSLFPQSAYHQVTSATLDSAHNYVDSFGTPQIQRNYIYRNAYDSISVSYGMNPQKYIEIELPLLLQYKLAENLSIFGGMQLAFGKVITIQGNMQRIQGTRIDTFSLPQVDTALPQTRPGLDGYFGYSTPEIGQLDENKYRNPITNPARFGAMLGFSYEFKKRLLIDLLMRKNLSNLNYIPNEQVRKIYSQPYFRITIGYKLFRSK